MDSPSPEFRAPSALERLFNKAFGALVGWGLDPQGYALLEVKGRTTGRVYSMPLIVLQIGGAMFLVAPRGRSQWARNVEAAPDRSVVQRYFPIPAGSPIEAFESIAARYPVFELSPTRAEGAR